MYIFESVRKLKRTEDNCVPYNTVHTRASFSFKDRAFTRAARAFPGEGSGARSPGRRAQREFFVKSVLKTVFSKGFLRKIPARYARQPNTEHLPYAHEW